MFASLINSFNFSVQVLGTIYFSGIYNFRTKCVYQKPGRKTQDKIKIIVHY